MPYANLEDRRRNDRARYAENPAPQLAATKAWVQKNPAHVHEYQTNWVNDNRGKKRAYGRRARFLQMLTQRGLTEAQYNEMWLAQGRKCKACGAREPNSKKGWCLDHNHATGKNRGIVCPSCNLIAGHAKDSPKHLRSVAEYLELNL
jgi:hypothetical protein